MIDIMVASEKALNLTIICVQFHIFLLYPFDKLQHLTMHLIHQNNCSFVFVFFGIFYGNQVKQNKKKQKTKKRIIGKIKSKLGIVKHCLKKLREFYFTVISFNCVGIFSFNDCFFDVLCLLFVVWCLVFVVCGVFDQSVRTQINTQK